MDSVQIDIVKDTTHTDTNKIINNIYNILFDKDNSFYKTFHQETYKKLINIENNKDTLIEILNSDEYIQSKKNLIPYFIKKKIFFDNNFDKIPDIINNGELGSILNININDKYIYNLGVALNIEKYYRDCKQFISECPEYPLKFPQPIFDPCKYPHVLSLYSHFYNYCYDQRQLHSITGDYFNRLNKFFFIPSIVLACFSSIFSFMSSMCFLNTSQRDILSILVGISSCMVALLQSLTSAYQFDAKSSHHHNSADLYDQIITSIDFEKNYPSNPNFFSDLEKDIIKIKSNCPFLVPVFIKKKHYSRKDKLHYQSFVKKSLILPARKEITESIQTGNKKLNINDNLEYYKKMVMNMDQMEKELLHKNEESKLV